MANPYHHALSSVNKWGGVVDDYLPIHQWFDATKAHHADFRHRALRHHAEGIFLMERFLGPVVTLSTCGKLDSYASHVRGGECSFTPKVIPTRWVGEQHVTEDLGRIPAATEWLSAIKAEPWMNRSRRLSRELDPVNREENECSTSTPTSTATR
jgi:hypothetical protein